MSLDDREALCVVPSHVPEAVPLAVSHNGHDVSPHAVRFHYRPPAVVDALFPEHGVSGGGTLVTITGAYFEQGEQAYCRVGARLVATDAVAASVIVCVFPPRRRGSCASASPTARRTASWTEKSSARGSTTRRPR